MSIQEMSLREVKRRLMDRIGEGTHCPACNQFAKVYRRKINSGMAYTLVRLWRYHGWNWTHLASIDKSREASKLEYWGLLENMTNDDGSRSGMWRITYRGAGFVKNRLSAPKYAHIYDGRLLELDDSETVTITEALGSKFNYRELMAGV